MTTSRPTGLVLATNLWQFRLVAETGAVIESLDLGRDLTQAEVAHFPGRARRIAAILLLCPALDASYQDCAAPS